MERRLAAIFAADVAGYSRLIGADEEGTLERLMAHRRELIDPKIAEHQGRIVKTTGDGVLVEFASPVKAVRCAIEVQHGMVDRNADVPQEQRIEFRIGINLGDVIVEDGDIYGDGVNVAARLEGIAEPGAVYISRAVRDFVNDQTEMALEDLGEKPLKNIAKPVRVFRIAAPDRAVAAPAAAGSPALPHKPSIAVLPFANMSGDAEQEYFSDGMTEDLITDLSKISGLFVIARNSSFAYKGQSVKVQEIGRDLGVRFVLEGSIRKAGNRVRITAQLIDAGSGGHLWAERFDRDLTDIFATQDEVVEKIVGALAVTLTQGEEQRLRRRGTANVEAYEFWLRARELLSRSTREAVAQARAMHRRAIELDPHFAAPHAGLALAAISDYVSDWAPDPAQALDESERWARRALELERSGAGEPHGARQRVAVAARSRRRARGVSPHDRARSQLCPGPFRDRTGADVCRPRRPRRSSRSRSRCGSTRTIRPSCCTSWRRRISAWDNTRPPRSSSSSASRAPPAPIRAACCSPPATAISGARTTRARHGRSFSR